MGVMVRRLVVLCLLVFTVSGGFATEGDEPLYNVGDVLAVPGVVARTYASGDGLLELRCANSLRVLVDLEAAFQVRSDRVVRFATALGSSLFVAKSPVYVLGIKGARKWTASSGKVIHSDRVTPHALVVVGEGFGKPEALSERARELFGDNGGWHGGGVKNWGISNSGVITAGVLWLQGRAAVPVDAKANVLMVGVESSKVYLADPSAPRSLRKGRPLWVSGAVREVIPTDVKGRPLLATEVRKRRGYRVVLVPSRLVVRDRSAGYLYELIGTESALESAPEAAGKGNR